MKRSPALAPLSREHQHALDAALRLRRADPGTVEDAVAHFRDFFEREGRAHFAIEEAHILPALPADDPQWSALAARVRDEHAAIREQAVALASSTSDRVGAARRLGEQLHDHVRFEERTLFALLEERLSPTDLARVGEAISDRDPA